MEPKIEVLEVARHRNGVTGEPFHAVRFCQTTPGRIRPVKDAPGGLELGVQGPPSTRFFLATVFEAAGHVAVLELESRVRGVIDLENRLRGDRFEADLRKAIAGFERRWKRLAGRGKAGR